MGDLRVDVEVGSRASPGILLLRSGGDVVGCVVVETWPTCVVLRAACRDARGGAVGALLGLTREQDTMAEACRLSTSLRDGEMARSETTFLDVLRTFVAAMRRESWPLAGTLEPGGHEGADEGPCMLAGLAATLAGGIAVAMPTATIDGARSALATFVATLDPAAVAMACPEASCSASRASLARVLADVAGTSTWPGLDGTFVAGAPLRAALEAEPDFPHAVIRSWSTTASAGWAAFGAAEAVNSHLTGAQGLTERGVDLARCVAKVLGRRRSDPRVDRFLDLADATRTDGATLLAEMAQGLPPSWTPGDDEGWSDLAAAFPLSMLGWGRSTPPGVPRDAQAAIWLPSGGRWGDFVRRAAKAAGTDVRHLQEACLDVRDAIHAFGCEVIVPSLYRYGGTARSLARGGIDHPGSLASEILTGGLSVVRVLEWSGRWHDGRPAMADALARLPWALPAPEWRPVLPDVLHGLGREVRVLTTEAGLVDEGRDGACADGSLGLSHCVGGYASHCLSGRLRVLSLRTPGPHPERTSTAAVSFDGGAPRLWEHRGPRNAPPSPADEAAVRGYLHMLCDGLLTWDPTGLVPIPDPRGGTPYDWRKAGAVDAVLDLWRPHLPKAHRHLTPARTWDLYDARFSAAKRGSHVAGITRPAP